MTEAGSCVLFGTGSSGEPLDIGVVRYTVHPGFYLPRRHLMSRKLTALLLAMLVLTGAMGLKTIVAGHSDGSFMMANGSAPPPPVPYRNGSAPPPPVPYRNGSAPPPPVPYK